MHLPSTMPRCACIWWALMGVLLIGFALTDGFDLGVGALLPFVARTDVERRMAINTIGPDLGRQPGLAHPRRRRDFRRLAVVYAVSFSGFYLAMFLVLLALILRPVGVQISPQASRALAGDRAGTGRFSSAAPSPRWSSASRSAMCCGAFPSALDGDLRPPTTAIFSACSPRSRC